MDRGTSMTHNIQLLRRSNGVMIALTLAVLFAPRAFATPTTGPHAPLADAAERADWPRVRALLKERAGVNVAQADGATALHWAAYHDDLETTKQLLAAGASVKAENRYGVTALTLACTNGNGELVRALLDAG